MLQCKLEILRSRSLAIRPPGFRDALASAADTLCAVTEAEISARRLPNLLKHHQRALVAFDIRIDFALDASAGRGDSCRRCAGRTAHVPPVRASSPTLRAPVERRPAPGRTLRRTARSGSANGTGLLSLSRRRGFGRFATAASSVGEADEDAAAR